MLTTKVTTIIVEILEIYPFFFQVYDAARRAAIHETILNFPEKYSTIVGERGLKVRNRSSIF